MVVKTGKKYLLASNVASLNELQNQGKLENGTLCINMLSQPIQCDIEWQQKFWLMMTEKQNPAIYFRIHYFKWTSVLCPRVGLLIRYWPEPY